jgi:predicted enzyme related to lactoylglutathione lyase
VSERTEYADGEFCWIDLASEDVDGAIRFYGGLLGWEAEPAPGPADETGGYGFFRQRGKLVGGYGPLQSEGQHPAWASYVKTSDADETAAKVREAGGGVPFGPVDLPRDTGRMGVCTDTEGAFFSIYEPHQMKGAELVNEVGSWTWNNLLTPDLAGAQEFYGKVFGWEAIHNEEAPPNILMWQVEGQRWPEGHAGLMGMTDEIPPETPPHWQVYLMVEKADDAINQIKGDGGLVLFGPIDIPTGRTAIVSDPEGVSFGIIESRYPEPR